MIMDTESESIVQAALDRVGTYRGRRGIILDTRASQLYRRHWIGWVLTGEGEG